MADLSRSDSEQPHSQSIDDDSSKTRLSLRKIAYSTAVIIIKTILPAILYAQDIIQDILVISSSVRSKEVHTVQTIIIIKERMIGFAMISIFLSSVLVVGLDTAMKMSRLSLVKRYKRIYVLMVVACVFNLGPVFIMFLKFFASLNRFKTMYNSEDEFERDQRVLDQALMSTKTKEAVCENLPMLVIVCFKIALSSRVSWLEILSSASSALIFSKVVIEYAMARLHYQSNMIKMLLWTLLMASFSYSTLILITTFAIEAENDGLLIGNDRTRGMEESSGLVFILLIFPILYFCLLPLTVYDLIPVFINGSSAIWQRFQGHPNNIWYFMTTFHSLAFFYNLGVGMYFFERDPIDVLQQVDVHIYRTGSQQNCFGFTIVQFFCSQWELKVGAGRIFFKLFALCSMIISSIVYLLSTIFIFGMRYRDRSHFRRAYEEVINSEREKLMYEISKNVAMENLHERCGIWMARNLQVDRNMATTRQGK